MMCVRERVSGSLSVLFPDLLHEDLCHRLVDAKCGDALQRAVRLVKDAKLAKERGAVVIDTLAGQTITILERVDAAERLDLGPRCARDDKFGAPGTRRRLLDLGRAAAFEPAVREAAERTRWETRSGCRAA